jgi:cob(I)alamin adenosyltransferase
MSIKKGMVYVFTGDGKGKTSAALGVTVRAVCNEMKVGWVSWYKGGKWPISEKKLPLKIKPEGRLKMYWLGEGFYKLPTDKATPEEHKRAASQALKKAEELLGKVEVLVLDEVNKAIEDGLIEVKEVVDLINKRGQVHLILTGRGRDKRIVEAADLVTEMKKIKHPFGKGVRVVKGLDF